MKASELLKLRFMKEQTISFEDRLISVSLPKYWILFVLRSMFFILIGLSSFVASGVMGIDGSHPSYMAVSLVSMVVGPALYYIVLMGIVKLDYFDLLKE